jgi:hypothetical protein
MSGGPRPTVWSSGSGRPSRSRRWLEGRIYRTLDDLRRALRTFVDLYNRHWRLEKLGGHTPDEVRQAWPNTQAA